MKIERDSKFQISYIDDAGNESLFRCSAEFADWVMARERDQRILRCAFCGLEYPPGTPSTQHQALTDHVMKCLKHPLRPWKVECLEALEGTDATSVGGLISHLQGEVERLTEERDTYEERLYDLKSEATRLQAEVERLRKIETEAQAFIKQFDGWRTDVEGCTAFPEHEIGHLASALNDAKEDSDD